MNPNSLRTLNIPMGTYDARKRTEGSGNMSVRRKSIQAVVKKPSKNKIENVG